MPNDCENTVTIYANTEVIQALVAAGIHISDLIHHSTLPEDLRLYDYTLHTAGVEAIVFTITSAWRPPHALLYALMNEYSICFIKNTWYVEDGSAGVWIAEPAKAMGVPPIVRSLEWDEASLEAKHDMFRKPAVTDSGEN